MATHTAQIPCSISRQFHAQLSQLDQSQYRTAVLAYLSNPKPTSPLTRDLLIKLSKEKLFPNRNLQITVNVLKTTREELKARAGEEGVTMSAILRRALFEYTKTAEPDLVAMYDAWGDAKKA